jgi:hypothetical protein
MSQLTAPPKLNANQVVSGERWVDAAINPPYVRSVTG